MLPNQPRANSEDEWEEAAREPPTLFSRAQAATHRLLDRRGGGVVGVYATFIALLIVVNIAAVVCESVTSWKAAIGDDAWGALEAVSVAVFSLELLGRLLSAPLCRLERDGYDTRWGYLTSFYGAVDILTVLPWYLGRALDAAGVPSPDVGFRVVRVFRIFQLERFAGAFTKLDDAFRRCRSNLAAFAVVAAVIWVGGGTLFYLSESDRDLQSLEGVRDAFDSVPSSLYFLAVFLGGEWGLTDFSVPGKLLCMSLVLIGIELYALPISVLFDAFQDVLDDDTDAAGGLDEEQGAQRRPQGLLAQAVRQHPPGRGVASLPAAGR